MTALKRGPRVGFGQGGLRSEDGCRLAAKVHVDELGHIGAGGGDFSFDGLDEEGAALRLRHVEGGEGGLPGERRRGGARATGNDGEGRRRRGGTAPAREAGAAEELRAKLLGAEGEDDGIDDGHDGEMGVSLRDEGRAGIAGGCKKQKIFNSTGILEIPESRKRTKSERLAQRSA